MICVNLVVEAEKMISVLRSPTAPAKPWRPSRSATTTRKSPPRCPLYRGQGHLLRTGAKYTDEAIHRHPYQSMAIVAGVCLLLGALLGRRRGA
jgi:hypothetical protein